MIQAILRDVLGTLTGGALFAICFLFPGYLLGHVTGVMQFRTRSLPERLLWAIALAGPLSTVWTCVAGRSLPSGVILGGLLAASAAGLFLLAASRRHRPTPPP